MGGTILPTRPNSLSVTRLPLPCRRNGWDGGTRHFTSRDQQRLISPGLNGQFVRVGWGNNPTSAAGAVMPKLAFDSLADERGFPLHLSSDPPNARRSAVRARTGYSITLRRMVLRVRIRCNALLGAARSHTLRFVRTECSRAPRWSSASSTLGPRRDLR